LVEIQLKHFLACQAAKTTHKSIAFTLEVRVTYPSSNL
jgi:hypothetical protein